MENTNSSPQPICLPLQISDHPVFLEMKSFPATTEDSALRAAVVFLDLCERKQWWHLSFFRDEALDSILVVGSPSKRGPLHLVLPTPDDLGLSMRKIAGLLKGAERAKREFLQTVRDDPEVTAPNPDEVESPSEENISVGPECSSNSLADSSESIQNCSVSMPRAFSPKLTLGIVSRGATIVYYHVTSGLVKPAPPPPNSKKLARQLGRRAKFGAETMAPRREVEEVEGGTEKVGYDEGGGGDGERREAALGSQDDWAEDVDGFWD